LTAQVTSTTVESPQLQILHERTDWSSNGC
jgi:hypothetical protein